MKDFPIVTTEEVLAFIREHRTVTTDEVMMHFAAGRIIPSWEIQPTRKLMSTKLFALLKQGYIEHPDRKVWRCI